MNYFILPNNNVCGYEDDQLIYVPQNAVKIPTTIETSDYQYLQLVKGLVVVVPLVLSTAQQIENNQTAIQEALDKGAQAKGYNDIKSACAYASSVPIVPSTDPNFDMCEKFRSEGNAFQLWMTSSWAAAYAYLATVTAGVNSMPTPTQAVAMMPSIPTME